MKLVIDIENIESLQLWHRWPAQYQAFKVIESMYQSITEQGVLNGTLTFKVDVKSYKLDVTTEGLSDTDWQTVKAIVEPWGNEFGKYNAGEQ